jgi:hypothetical protein
LVRDTGQRAGVAHGEDPGVALQGELRRDQLGGPALEPEPVVRLERQVDVRVHEPRRHPAAREVACAFDRPGGEPPARHPPLDGLGAVGQRHRTHVPALVGHDVPTLRG